ncbi:MAG: hypothetical protein H3C64_04420 [Candidatus Kuenenia stuttgartiensis]|nr:hypothetical protein [Candidatus Kuenenia stuttgartiensis]
MTYYIDILSPDTYEGFSKSDMQTTGFRERQKGINQLQVGDKLICYVTKISRWVGVLEVKSESFVDKSPIYSESDDPFIVRFKVNPVTWLPHDKSLPINDDFVWDNLSFTKELEKGSNGWTIMVRSSLRKLDDADGLFLENAIKSQVNGGKVYPLTDTDRKKIEAFKIRTTESKQISVSVPEDIQEVSTDIEVTSRESILIQALLSEIGERMNLKVWLPKSDRQRVLEHWPNTEKCLLDQLPLNYDNATLKTIENIDVIWIKGRSIIRAFEVEHTTSIYSGILRMADLMALQPNLSIQAHIVAPEERKDKVFQEITRPVFSLLDSGPLSDSCSFISYQSIKELAKEKRLEYMNDSVLEEYCEYPEV